MCTSGRVRRRPPSSGRNATGHLDRRMVSSGRNPSGTCLPLEAPRHDQRRANTPIRPFPRTSAGPYPPDPTQRPRANETRAPPPRTQSQAEPSERPGKIWFGNRRSAREPRAAIGRLRPSHRHRTLVRNETLQWAPISHSPLLNGTNTSSRKTQLKTSSPVSSLSGRTSMPGVVMSTAAGAAGERRDVEFRRSEPPLADPARQAGHAAPWRRTEWAGSGLLGQICGRRSIRTVPPPNRAARVPQQPDPPQPTWRARRGPSRGRRHRRWGRRRTHRRRARQPTGSAPTTAGPVAQRGPDDQTVGPESPATRNQEHAADLGRPHMPTAGPGSAAKARRPDHRTRVPSNHEPETRSRPRQAPHADGRKWVRSGWAGYTAPQLCCPVELQATDHRIPAAWGPNRP
ncbi:hypothetical protein FB559_0706 [Actinoallomurus bryophytorum]|uniref:Uncharacterized protein n=1 Tax=Actinoallomurus bryophytorum TaxID=1490222 RepID=A0A543CDN0_9ACTN|nr:hypothetical protein FB559_0706 [Actinoallomurus bryophytorum]